ncbi:cell wall-binding repeat-containing protein [Desulfitobacterium chlororespirans]|nr:cell wall-binding repeat-containing protein [Desulfitobacterium chlororespirans]
MAMERMPLTQSDKGSIYDIFYEEKIKMEGEFVMSMRKIITGSLLILAFVFTFCFPAATMADTSPTVTRLAGYDRYETAAEIAKSGWTKSDYAVLAYGENYPDALTAVPLAYKYDAPILLTKSNSMPEVTKRVISGLQVKNVIIIGGTGVIYASVEEELEAMGIDVNRVFGYDRYETAVEVAKQITAAQDSPELFVVTGEDYPDALSVGSIAGFKQMPIILVPSDGVPDSVKNYVSSANVNKSYVIGYSDVVSDLVYNEFPKAERILGVDKYSRNIAVNQKFENEFKSEKICLATGEVFADALSGGAYAAKIGEPVILVNNDPPDNIKSYYQQRAAKANKVSVFGGTGIVPERVIENLNQGSTIWSDSVYPTGISLNKSILNIPAGGSETLTALLEASDASGNPVYGNSGNVTWSSSNPAVATVSDSGKVVGVKEGTTVITVTVKDGGKTASCNVGVYIDASFGNNLDFDKFELTISDLKIGATEATFKFQLLKNGEDITELVTLKADAFAPKRELKDEILPVSLDNLEETLKERAAVLGKLPVTLNYSEKKGTIKFEDPSDGERLRWIYLYYEYNENGPWKGLLGTSYDCWKDGKQILSD